MSLLFGFIDLLLTTLITLDTLGLVGQFRQKKTPDSKDYTRVCFTWILYLTLKSFTPNDGGGTLRKILLLIFLFAKIFVVLPILGGTMLIYNQAPQLIKKGADFTISKMGINSPGDSDNKETSETSKIPSTSTALSPDDDES